MDYAFVPGTTDYELAMQALLRNRLQTEVTSSGAHNVAAFLAQLHSSATVAKPISNILISSHASDQGWLLIDLDSSTNGQISYEDLDAVRISTSINVPGALINPRPNDGAGNPIPAFVHIKGCRIGTATPYLQLLKTALGGSVRVTAPKHFHGNYGFPGDGYVEYLAYSYEINRKTAFANRAAAIAAFKAGGFTRIDNSAIPDAKWNTYIPQNISAAKTQVNHQVVLAQPINGRTAISNLNGEFRHKRASFGPFEIDYGSGSPPTNAAQQLSEIRNSFLTDSQNRWSDTHAFPVFRRLGYANFTDFMDGMQWQMAVNGSVLSATGLRHEYTCIVPITDPANNQLFFNFYPNSGSGLSPITLLQESDARFFATV